MKRKVIVGLICMLALAVPTVNAAVTINEVSVEIVQDLGAIATYTADTMSLRWTGGGQANVLFGNGKLESFTSDITIDATLGGLVDTSDPDGLMQGTFNSGSYTLTIGGTLEDPYLQMGGSLAWRYQETEDQAGEKLAGSCIMTVDDDKTFFNTTYFGNKWGLNIDNMVWGDGDGLAGVITSILFPPGTDLIDYSTDYTSGNASITFVADESSIPEPATMILLGLGSLIALRRRK